MAFIGFFESFHGFEVRRVDATELGPVAATYRNDLPSEEEAIEYAKGLVERENIPYGGRLDSSGLRIAKPWIPNV